MSVFEPAVGHHGGIADLLTAGLQTIGADYVVYRGAVPISPVFPYCVVWGAPSAPLPDAERIAGWGGEIVTTTQITVAGLSANDVLGGCDRVLRVLHRRRPVVAGRRCGDLGFTGSPGRPTESPTRTTDGHPIYFTALLFDLCSNPT